MKKKLIILLLIIVVIIFFFLIKKDNSTGSLKAISYKELISMVNDKKDFILIVSRSTCSHCAEYKPKVEEIAEKNNITVYYIDYDLESEKNQNKLLKKFNLNGSTPITLFIENGKETSVLNRLEGDLDSTTVKQKFKKMGFIK